MASADGRQKTAIGDAWKFTLYLTGNEPAAVQYDDRDWPTVSIPHTWNATDAQDGGNNYVRTVGWYRKILPWKPEYHGKRLYIECTGANLLTECFVNGIPVGQHKGGYTAFRFDITESMHPGDNVIAFKVDNRLSEEIAPLTADFSFFGGIYRNLFLVAVHPLHVDLSDSGAGGLYLTTSKVSAESATLEVRARIVNESATACEATLTATLRYPDTFEAIPEIARPAFDPHAVSPGGAPLRTVTRTVTVPAFGEYVFTEQTVLTTPRLWDGKRDPFRYRVDFRVAVQNRTVDSLSDYVGFRFFSADTNGFHLNGRPYPLRGVNRHQDRLNMGNAISEKEHSEDFGLIYEMGANAIRLAHYPHDPYFYDLCDRYGLVVWAEIPFVDRPGKARTFTDVTRNQLQELIRQQYNRPSILMWGLHNEVRTDLYDSLMSRYVPALTAFAHAEDPSRLTVQAQAGASRFHWTSDLYAFNRYPGWYQGGSVGSCMDPFKGLPQPVGLSEYGAGANVGQHEINPARPRHDGPHHPEEYQNRIHEDAIRDIAARPWIWGTFVWNMFDFASDGRNEGDRPGINDKGLVTYDRRIRKDAYYLYKVNWNSEPEIYIASRRYTDRPAGRTPITVYSNCDEVELWVNGISQGIRRKADAECGIFRWDDVLLPPQSTSADTANGTRIVAKGKLDGQEYSDQLTIEELRTKSYEL
jgi:hypothetical protein